MKQWKTLNNRFYKFEDVQSFVKSLKDLDTSKVYKIRRTRIDYSKDMFRVKECLEQSKEVIASEPKPEKEKKFSKKESRKQGKELSNIKNRNAT